MFSEYAFGGFVWNKDEFGLTLVVKITYIDIEFQSDGFLFYLFHTLWFNNLNPQISQMTRITMNVR